MRKDYAKYFQTKRRISTQEKFRCLTDDAPVALVQLVRDIHFDHFDGCLPNDWIYETIDHAFDALLRDDIDDCCIDADDYTSDLIRWLQNPFAFGYCDEALAGLEGAKDLTLNNIIQIAQWEAKDVIYRTVNDFIQEENEQTEEENNA